jgi:hypothetical protein
MDYSIAVGFAIGVGIGCAPVCIGQAISPSWCAMALGSCTVALIGSCAIAMGYSIAMGDCSPPLGLLGAFGLGCAIGLDGIGFTISISSCAVALSRYAVAFGSCAVALSSCIIAISLCATVLLGSCAIACGALGPLLGIRYTFGLGTSGVIVSLCISWALGLSVCASSCCAFVFGDGCAVPLGCRCPWRWHIDCAIGISWAISIGCLCLGCAFIAPYIAICPLIWSGRYHADTSRRGRVEG